MNKMSESRAKQTLSHTFNRRHHERVHEHELRGVNPAHFKHRGYPDEEFRGHGAYSHENKRFVVVTPQQRLDELAARKTIARGAAWPGRWAAPNESNTRSGTVEPPSVARANLARTGGRSALSDTSRPPGQGGGFNPANTYRVSMA